MAGVVLVRADDHLVLGVRWSGFTVSGTGAAARLTAGAQARILVVLPPQHIGEETSPPDSYAPLHLPAGGGGGVVPGWRGVLSAPTRLKFKVKAGTQIPLTSEGKTRCTGSTERTSPGLSAKTFPPVAFA